MQITLCVRTDAAGKAREILFRKRVHVFDGAVEEFQRLTNPGVRGHHDGPDAKNSRGVFCALNQEQRRAVRRGAGAAGMAETAIVRPLRQCSVFNGEGGLTDIPADSRVTPVGTAAAPRRACPPVCTSRGRRRIRSCTRSSVTTSKPSVCRPVGSARAKGFRSLSSRRSAISFDADGWPAASRGFAAGAAGSTGSCRSRARGGRSVRAAAVAAWPSARRIWSIACSRMSRFGSGC